MVCRVVLKCCKRALAKVRRTFLRRRSDPIVVVVVVVVVVVLFVCVCLFVCVLVGW